MQKVVVRMGKKIALYYKQLALNIAVQDWSEKL